MASANDSFSSDQNPLSGNWTTPAGAPVKAASGVAKPTDASGTTRVAAYTGTSFAANQRVAVTAANAGMYGVNRIGPCARMDSNADGYCTIWRSWEGDAKLYKRVSGTLTQIGSTLNLGTTGQYAITNGDILRIDVTGSSPVSIEFFYKGTSIGTITDSGDTFTSGSPGLLVTFEGEGHITYWEAEDLSVAATFVPRIIMIS